MKKLAVFAMALFMIAGAVYAKEFAVSKKAGDYSMLIKIDRNPPIAGDNNVEITITDGAGKAVTDAKVVITYSMPAMAGMPAMRYKANLEAKGNVYRTEVNYSMAGSWNNEVKMTHNGKTASTRFTIDAK